MNADNVIAQFLDIQNLTYLAHQTNYDLRKLKAMARKWSVLSNLDNMIEKIPNLRELNDMFIDYYHGLLHSELQWDEVLLRQQTGYWPNQRPNRNPLNFHPLYRVDQSLPGNPAYTARAVDTYESQSTEYDNNLYRAHYQRLPLSYNQMKVPHNRGELSAYEIFMRSRRQ